MNIKLSGKKKNRIEKPVSYNKHSNQKKKAPHTTSHFIIIAIYIIHTNRRAHTHNS